MTTFAIDRIFSKTESRIILYMGILTINFLCLLVVDVLSSASMLLRMEDIKGYT